MDTAIPTAPRPVQRGRLRVRCHRCARGDRPAEPHRRPLTRRGHGGGDHPAATGAAHRGDPGGPAPRAATPGEALSLEGNTLLDAFKFIREAIPQMQEAGMTIDSLAEVIATTPHSSGSGTFGDVMLPDGIRTMAIALLQVDATVLDPVLNGVPRVPRPDQAVRRPDTDRRRRPDQAGCGGQPGLVRALHVDLARRGDAPSPKAPDTRSTTSSPGASRSAPRCWTSSTATDGPSMVTIRPFDVADRGCILAGRDEETQRWLGAESPESVAHGGDRRRRSRRRLGRRRCDRRVAGARRGQRRLCRLPRTSAPRPCRTSVAVVRRAHRRQHTDPGDRPGQRGVTRRRSARRRPPADRPGDRSLPDVAVYAFIPGHLENSA